jgi:hypothetical protein
MMARRLRLHGNPAFCFGRCWRDGLKVPRPKILGHIGRGASHGRGEDRVFGPSQRAGSQRLRDSSTTPHRIKCRYPQRSLRLRRVTKPRRDGRRFLEELAVDEPHRLHGRRLQRHLPDAARGRSSVAGPSFGTANAFWPVQRSEEVPPAPSLGVGKGRERAA